MLLELYSGGVVGVALEGAHGAHEVRVADVRGQGFAVKAGRATNMAARVGCHVLLVSLVIVEVQFPREEMTTLSHQPPKFLRNGGSKRCPRRLDLDRLSNTMH